MPFEKHWSLKLKQCFAHSYLSFTNSKKDPATPSACGERLQCQSCAACGQGLLILGMGGCSEMSLGTSIPAPAGILSLSAGSLDELAVIVTSADLESH